MRRYLKQIIKRVRFKYEFKRFLKTASVRDIKVVAEELEKIGIKSNLDEQAENIVLAQKRSFRRS